MLKKLIIAVQVAILAFLTGILVNSASASETDSASVTILYVIPSEVSISDHDLLVTLLKDNGEARSEQFQVAVTANQAGTVSVRCSAYSPTSDPEWDAGAAAGAIRMLNISGDSGFISATITDTDPISATTGSIIKNASTMSAGETLQHTFQVGVDPAKFDPTGTMLAGSYSGGINVLAVYQ